MPQDQVIASARRLSEDQAVTESATISYLAQGFDVSEEAMQYRLINLGLRRQV